MSPLETLQQTLQTRKTPFFSATPTLRQHVPGECRTSNTTSRSRSYSSYSYSLFPVWKKQCVNSTCMPHKPSAPSYTLGGKKRQHIANMANIFFQCVHGDWVVQPLGHAAPQVVHPPSLLNPRTSGFIFGHVLWQDFGVNSLAR